MCKHILVVRYVDGGKHAIKECVDRFELDAAILDAQSKPGTMGYEVFDLVAKVTKTIEWRETDVTTQDSEASTQADATGDSSVGVDLATDGSAGTTGDADLRAVG